MISGYLLNKRLLFIWIYALWHQKDFNEKIPSIENFFANWNEGLYKLTTLDNEKYTSSFINSLLF